MKNGERFTHAVRFISADDLESQMEDWGGEFSCPNITFEDDNFKAVEESGKPGNYNISPSLGDDTSYKSAVAKITFIVPKSGNTTHFRSTILVESDLD